MPPGLRAAGRWSRTSGGLFIPREYAWVHRNLRGAWIADEGAGTVLRDISGGQSHGVLTAGAGWTNLGLVGSALDFPGTAGPRVEITPQPLLTRSYSGIGFSIAALCRLASYSGGNVPTIFDASHRITNSVTAGGPFMFRPDNNSGVNALRLQVVDSTDTENSYMVDNMVTTGVWAMYGVTYRKRQDADVSPPWEIIFYRDGKPSAPAYTNRKPTRAWTRNPTIGAREDGQNRFTGQIAGVWIWGYGFSRGQMARFMADPFAAWRPDFTYYTKSGSAPSLPPQGGGVASIYRRRRGGL